MGLKPGKGLLIFIKDGLAAHIGTGHHQRRLDPVG